MIRRKNGNIETEWHGDEILLRSKPFLSGSLFEIGLFVEGQAKLLCPVDTGQLKSSITTQMQDQGTEVESPATEKDQIKKPAKSNECLVGTAVKHGPWKEYGTKFQDAQPFLRPALAIAQGQVLHLVKKNGKTHFKEFIYIK